MYPLQNNEETRRKKIEREGEGGRQGGTRETKTERETERETKTRQTEREINRKRRQGRAGVWGMGRPASAKFLALGESAG